MRFEVRAVQAGVYREMRVAKASTLTHAVALDDLNGKALAVLCHEVRLETMGHVEVGEPTCAKCRVRRGAMERAA